MVSKAAPSRILVVDDDPAERLGLSTMISSLGYVVETAQHGEEALEKLGSLSVDVIVTDLIMPQMDGYGLLRALLERGDLTPAIVLTGFGSIDKAPFGALLVWLDTGSGSVRCFTTYGMLSAYSSETHSVWR